MHASRPLSDVGLLISFVWQRFAWETVVAWYLLCLLTQHCQAPSRSHTILSPGTRVAAIASIVEPQAGQKQLPLLVYDLTRPGFEPGSPSPEADAHKTAWTQVSSFETLIAGKLLIGAQNRPGLADTPQPGLQFDASCSSLPTIVFKRQPIYILQ